MDPNTVQAPTTSQLKLCTYCHQPLKPEYYYCPNCGKAVHDPPLSTEPLTQLGIYAFSIILPMICYLAITKWPGLKYYRSSDEKAKQVGAIAIILLVLSSIVTFYYAYVWTEEAIQQATTQVNQELNAE